MPHTLAKNANNTYDDGACASNSEEYLHFQWKLPPPSFSVFIQPTMRELFRNKVETRQTFLWHCEREITTDKSERKIMVVVVKLWIEQWLFVENSHIRDHFMRKNVIYIFENFCENKIDMFHLHCWGNFSKTVTSLGQFRFFSIDLLGRWSTL